MGKCTPETLEYWHNKGQEDVKEGIDSLFGGPWGGLESSEHYHERNNAYESGRENALNQK